MTHEQLNVVALVGIVTCWVAFALTWLGGAIFYESRAPQDRTRAGFGSTALIGISIVLVVSAIVPRRAWNSIVIDTTWVRLAGLAVLVAATAFTVWARLVLGSMWSAAPTVKEGHQLRTGGPYAVTRHPIYTGMLGMMLGSLLLAGAGRWILPFPIFLVLLEIKIHIEERLMLAEFPDDYPRYRKRVPQLLPGLRLPGRSRVASGSAG